LKRRKLINQSSLDDALKYAISNHQARIGYNDELFLQRIYRQGLSKYVDRLKAIGFTNQKSVLDAGCGYGQWSLALAQENKLVNGCDTSPLRLDVFKDITKELAVANIEICLSSLDNLPYSDESFDAVFCYGVIFLTPWRQSLRELTRVLKPGGSLYVNANSLGWYVFLWKEEHNKANDYDPRMIAANSFKDTLSYDRYGHFQPGMSISIEPQQMEIELLQLGHTDIKIADEGCLYLDSDNIKPQSFFKGEYYGLAGVYEIISKKL
jgi:SAM-dependent methyltransferase